MSLAKSYSRALYSQVRCYAAWFPVANTFALGDYGLIDGGVFRKLGNLSEFKVGFRQRTSRPAPIDFSSEGTTVTYMVGDAKVKALPQQADGEAKVAFNFARANSCLIKARITVTEIQDVGLVADKLFGCRGWERRFRVVSKVYNGQKCIIVAAEKANTTVEFSGAVNLLSQLQAGTAGSRIGFSSTSERIFKSVGATGVIGLNFFRHGIFRKIVLESSAGAIETDKDWGASLKDDL